MREMVLPKHAATDRCWSVQHPLGFDLSLIRSAERDCEIESCSSFEDEANTSQNAVDLSEGTKTIAVHEGQAHRLLQQFHISHCTYSPGLPHWRGRIAYLRSRNGHKKNHEECTREKYTLGSCSALEQVANTTLDRVRSRRIFRELRALSSGKWNEIDSSRSASLVFHKQLEVAA